MKPVIPKTKDLILLAVFIFALILSRTVNLDKTARFLWDESSDLVHMHEIYVDKKITLIGPISEDGSKVFGSLTYYMLMPFAVAGDFDPISTAYGAAFWGVLTGILILYLSYRINKNLIYLIAPIIILWYPLVQTGRWAWNPNLIPFWVTLSLIFYSRKKTFSKFLSGLFIGLAIHHHYLAIFAAFGFAVVVFADSLREKKMKNFIVFILGVILAAAPFVLFDMTHPPGLFLSRILYFNNLGQNISYIEKLYLTVNGTFFYFTQSAILEILLVLSVLTLVIFDIKSKSRSLWFILVVVIQLVGISFVDSFNTHYILPALPFFIVYLIYPRKKLSGTVSFISILILLVSGIFSFPSQINNVSWEGNIKATRYITSVISSEITKNDLKNNNIAVLDSPDPNTYGRRYRDLLLIDNVPLKTKGEYEISDHLFVITTSSLDTVRNDPAFEIKYFRRGKEIGEWDVPESGWKIYLLTRS